MASDTQDPLPVLVPARPAWQMSGGERIALEGLLSQVSPKLAVEIGTAEGGSLRRIAAHSDEVHSFDLVAPADDLAVLENVTFHTGDSHQLLGEFLAQAAAERRSIDFVLIDGDHSADGVRRDILDVLGSDAVTSTVIVLHDTLNPEVRRGIEAAEVASHPKVARYELDLVAGYLVRREPFRLQMWGGLGLIVLDAGHRPPKVSDDGFHELYRVLRPSVDVMAELERRGTRLDGLSGEELEDMLRREAAASRAERDRLAARLESIEESRGWRLVMAARDLRRLATAHRST
jgi:hypothetical protein